MANVANRKVDSESWRLFYDGLCEISTLADGSVSASVGGQFVMVTTFGCPGERNASAVAALASGIDCIGATLVQQGRLEATVGASTFMCGPGDVIVHDMSAPRLFARQGDAPLAEATLYIPRRRVASMLGAATPPGWCLKAAEPMSAIVGGNLSVLATFADRLSPTELDTVAAAVTDILSKIAVPAGIGDAETAQFSGIRRFIERHVTSDALTPDLIAGQFGMSRSVLYRLFEPLGGVKSYIRRQRMARALQDLRAEGSAGQRISVVAHRYGYENAAAFSRAFREAYGVSPRNMRIAIPVRKRGERLIDLLAPLCGHIGAG